VYVVLRGIPQGDQVVLGISSAALDVPRCLFSSVDTLLRNIGQPSRLSGDLFLRSHRVFGGHGRTLRLLLGLKLVSLIWRALGNPLRILGARVLALGGLS
jgi:hypothetical protein